MRVLKVVVLAVVAIVSKAHMASADSPMLSAPKKMVTELNKGCSKETMRSGKKPADAVNAYTGTMTDTSGKATQLRVCCNARGLKSFPLDAAKLPLGRVSRTGYANEKGVKDSACCVPAGFPCSREAKGVIACCNSKLCDPTSKTCVNQTLPFDINFQEEQKQGKCSDRTRTFFRLSILSAGDASSKSFISSFCCDANILQFTAIDKRKHCCSVSGSVCDQDNEALAPCCAGKQNCQPKPGSPTGSQRLAYCVDNLSGSPDSPDLDEVRPNLGSPVLVTQQNSNNMPIQTVGCCSGTGKIFLQRGCCEGEESRFLDTKTIESKCCSTDDSVKLNKCPARDPKPIKCTINTGPTQAPMTG